MKTIKLIKSSSYMVSEVGKKELDFLIKNNIITKVNEPTPWVNSLVTVSKPNGKVRLCLDAKHLNEAIIPTRYRLKNMEELKNLMPGARYFSKLDLSHGFHQIELDEESSKLCTFNTLNGRYRYRRLAFGIKDASEIFQQKMEREFGEWALIMVDDLLVYGKTKEEHDEKLLRVLNKANKLNIKFNPAKLEVGKEELSFSGHIVSKDGLKPDPKKVQAITNMPSPKTKEALKSLMGMLAYLGKFIPHLAEVTEPLREIQKKGVIFEWKTPQEKAFNRLKKILAKAENLQHYDVNKPVTLQVDASKNGLGACLLQENRPVEYASISLTETQQQYSQLEKEALAINFGCMRFHYLIFGKTTLLNTDHKPLETIIKKSLHTAPPRVRRLLIPLQRYDIKVEWKRGSQLKIADAL